MIWLLIVLAVWLMVGTAAWLWVVWVASSDMAAVIPKGEAAIITMDGMTKLALVIPQLKGDHKVKVPELLLFLTACMARGDTDPDFLREQVEWMEARKRK